MQPEKALTPEEYYQRAYKRNIAIGEMFLKDQPRPKYETPLTQFSFDFDPKAYYVHLGHEESEAYLGHTSMKFDVFKRISDGALAKFTKYSHIIIT